MFPISNNSLRIQGLAGGRNYRIVVRVYPKDPQYVEIESNSLVSGMPVLFCSMKFTSKIS